MVFVLIALTQSPNVMNAIMQLLAFHVKLIICCLKIFVFHSAHQATSTNKVYVKCVYLNVWLARAQNPIASHVLQDII